MCDTGNHPASTADLTVLISCPLLLADNQLRCTIDKGSTIEHLKKTISARLDSQPSAADQRLIFRGRILEDTEILEQVFEKIDYIAVPPTVHLVVSQLHSSSPSFTHSAPESPTPLRFRHNTSQGRAGMSSSSSSSAPNAADTRASSAPPLSSIPPRSDASSSSSTSTTSATTAGPSTADQPKAQETVAPPPPYSYTPVLPWLNPVHHTLLQPYEYVIVNGLPYLMPAGYLPLLQQQQQQQQQLAMLGYPMAYGPMMMMNVDGSTTLINSSMAHGQLRTTTGTTADPGDAPIVAAAAAAPAAVAGGDGEAVAPRVALNPEEIAARDQRRAQHQTGRLRIVRRIVPVNQDDPGNANANRPQDAGAPAGGQDAAAGETGPSGAFPADASSNNSTSMSSSSSMPAGDSLEEKGGGEGSSTMSASGNENSAAQRGASSSSSSPSSSATTSSGGGGAGASNGDTSPRQTNTNAQDQQAVEVPQGRVSVWRSIEHALLTFVTSLVPAPQPEMDPAVANVAAAGERM
ncbi:hypothetical protein BGZ73_000759 [Actinomortierella ambigua]|nr:hypothetical protein BGZ73_000759 [Actinomortierella ambigua]